MAPDCAVTARFGIRLRGYRAFLVPDSTGTALFQYPIAQLPRVFGTRLHGYRALLAKIVVVVWRVWQMLVLWKSFLIDSEISDRMFWHPFAQLPRVFSTRLRSHRASLASDCAVTARFGTGLRSYRAFLAPDRAVTALFWHPTAQIQRALAPDCEVTARVWHLIARLPRVFGSRLRNHRTFLAKIVALA